MLTFFEGKIAELEKAYMKKKILITKDFGYTKLEELRKTYDIEVNETGRDYTYNELNEKLHDKDAVICMLTNTIDEQLMKNNIHIKVYCNYAMGFNNIDVKYAKENHIYVTNTPNVLNDVTSELAWALLLAVSRRVIEGDRYMRDMKFTGWEPLLFLGKQVSNRTVGIIGAGNIGQAFGRKAKAFNMNIVYWSRTRKPDFEEETSARYVTLNELYQVSDFISLHLPANDETYHLINKEAFELMKDDAILVNTSRGNIVDEEALIETLETRKIWGAGLDVYENESDINERLLKLDNIVVLPHVGGGVKEIREQMGDIVFKNLSEAFSGKLPCTNIWRE